MAGRDYLDKRMFMLGEIPFEERIDQWVWILDKRIIKRYATQKERETLVKGLVCLKCGSKCQGLCDNS